METKSTSVEARSQARSPSLFRLLREDWHANQPRALARPGFHALVLHRIGHAGAERQHAALPIRTFRAFLTFVTQAIYGIDLPWPTTVGRRVVIAHQSGVVIAPNAVVGDDCLIRQNVTIGAAIDGGRAPRIGDRVRIGAGAVIVGDIVIGDDATIGPNSVVTTNIHAGSTVVAAPSRVLVQGNEPADRQLRDNAGGSFSPDDVASVIREALSLRDPIGTDTPLLTSGLIDSLNLVLVLDAIEFRYAVPVLSDDVTAETFDTPSQIAEFLRGRRA